MQSLGKRCELWNYLFPVHASYFSAPELCLHRWWVMSWTVNLVLERLGQGIPIYPSVWSSSTQPWSPGCFSLSVSVNSVPHQYGVGKKKKKKGLLATILCKLSYLLKARDLVSLKVWGFFIIFKSPLCNKSVFFWDVYFLGTSAAPCCLPACLSCSLLFHCFSLTSVKRGAGICCLPSFLSSWIISTGLEINDIEMLWAFFFFPSHTLLARHGFEKKKAIPDFCSGRACSVLEKLSVLCCRWIRKLMDG